MASTALLNDPYNLIITGVGGQGNVMASRVVGNMLARKGYRVTIGETFGASQRGGSVMSHMRVSSQASWSPQIPAGRAHLVIALEPTEAIRVLVRYGNPAIKVICNTRPIQSVGVICGELLYPGFADLQSWIRELSSQAWFLDATNTAVKLGNPIFGNVLMIGALAGAGELPVDRQDFEAVISPGMAAEKVNLNLKAFDLGWQMVQPQ